MRHRLFAVYLLVLLPGVAACGSGRRSEEGGRADTPTAHSDSTDPASTDRSVPADTGWDSTRRPAQGSPEAAVAVVRDYYAAIDDRDYRQAYDAWGDGGAMSGQTFEAFEAGFAETASVSAAVGTPGRVEGAAGSRYIELPVTVTATTTEGAAQRFTGRYVLRRAVVDGASPQQRRWHLSSADLVQVDADVRDADAR